MADIFATDFNAQPLHMDAHGNATIEHYMVKANAVIGDKLYFGIIPSGTEVALVRWINEATAGSVTMKLGFEPYRGTVPTADDDYFSAAVSITSAGAAFSNALPFLFEQPVMLVGTIAGANFGSAKQIDVIVMGKAVGSK